MFNGRIHRQMLAIWRASRHDQRANERILHQTLPHFEALEKHRLGNTMAENDIWAKMYEAAKKNIIQQKFSLSSKPIKQLQPQKAPKNLTETGDKNPTHSIALGIYS